MGKGAPEPEIQENEVQDSSHEQGRREMEKDMTYIG